MTNAIFLRPGRDTGPEELVEMQPKCGQGVSPHTSLTTNDTKSHKGQCLQELLRVPSCPFWFRFSKLTPTKARLMLVCFEAVV